MNVKLKAIIYIFFSISIIVILFSCNENKEHVAPLEKPNIIFIMADDLGYADLGCYGQKVIRTPELDQMAKEGMLFTDCYSGSPVCAPSRSVLMTGQHTGHTTVRGNFGKGGVVGLGGGKGRISLSEKDISIAKVLQNKSYTTGMIGKWGLGEPNTFGVPALQGFDYFFGFINQRRAHSYYPEYVWENDKKVILEGNQNGQKNEYIDERFTLEAIKFIEKNKQSPFFLYLPYTLPHDKYEIPSLGHFADSTHWTENEKVYGAMVERLSNDVGRIIQTLKKENIDQNTIVFFCSDNGPASRWTNRFNSSGILKGRKRDTYEGGIRVPMIVRYPGKFPAGKVSSFPWYFADVLPTIATLAKAEIPSAVDGIDVSKILFGDKNSERDDPMYWEFYEGGFQQAIRWKNYKGVLKNSEIGWEIYDLSNDVSESINIAELNPKVVSRMIQIANESHTKSSYFDRNEN